jgi:hypothetical protein
MKINEGVWLSFYVNANFFFVYVIEVGNVLLFNEIIPHHCLFHVDFDPSHHLVIY